MVTFTEVKRGKVNLLDLEGVTTMLQAIRTKLDVLEARLVAVENRSARWEGGVDGSEEEGKGRSGREMEQSNTPFDRLQEDDSFLAYAESFVLLADRVELSKEAMVAKFMEGLRRDNSKLIRILSLKTLRQAITFGKVLTANEDPYRSREETSDVLMNSDYSESWPNAKQEGSNAGRKTYQDVCEVVETTLVESEEEQEAMLSLHASRDTEMIDMNQILKWKGEPIKFKSKRMGQRPWNEGRCSKTFEESELRMMQGDTPTSVAERVVGGIEAEAAMFGQPLSMVMPGIVGFKLPGRLCQDVTATDLALTVTQILRNHGAGGKLVEFYGNGMGKLSLTDRVTIVNVSPEYDWHFCLNNKVCFKDFVVTREVQDKVARFPCHGQSAELRQGLWVLTSEEDLDRIKEKTGQLGMEIEPPIPNEELRPDVLKMHSRAMKWVKRIARAMQGKGFESLYGYFPSIQTLYILGATTIKFETERGLGNRDAVLRQLQLQVHQAQHKLVQRGYGNYETDDLPENDQLKGAVDDSGHSSRQVSITVLEKEKLILLAHLYDRSLGGREVDEVLVLHLAERIRKQYKVKVYQKARPCLKPWGVWERLKRVLSANPEAMLNMECLIIENDGRNFIKGDEVEQISTTILERVKNSLDEACGETNRVLENIYTIEVVVPGFRILARVKIRTESFGRKPKHTRNASECFAKGSVLKCATLSLTFKVHELQVKEVLPFPLSISGKVTTPEVENKGVRNHQSTADYPKENPILGVEYLHLTSQAF